MIMKDMTRLRHEKAGNDKYTVDDNFSISGFRNWKSRDVDKLDAHKNKDSRTWETKDREVKEI